jgi:HlyD family secretion protein/epimerase transport system membrane fusion protein
MPDRSRRKTTSAPSLRRELRWVVIAGVAVIAIFFAGLGGWAAVAPLASAAIAPGVVSPEGSRRRVQHLEGGIIRELRVQDGSRVKSGDLLIVLENLHVRTEHEVLESRWRGLIAERARLQAELDRAERIDFPAQLIEAAADPAVGDLLAAEVALFEAGRQAMADRQALLRQQIDQLREEIRGLEVQIDNDAQQLRLVQQDLSQPPGPDRQDRSAGLRRAAAEIQGRRAARQADITRARHAIAESELKIKAMATVRNEDVTRELSEIRQELAEAHLRIRASQDVLRRTEIRAPIGGTVVAMRVNTPGGVIQPGEPILDIVPEDEELVIEIRVTPTDVDVVRSGLRTQVILPAYNQRTLPRIEGEVVEVSADALADPQTGQSYFMAKVRVAPETLEGLSDDIDLLPGMPAEVFIMTGERTALDYILEPFLDSIRRSARET